MTGHIASLSLSPDYNFSKICTDRVRLIEGLGVKGDVHAGKTVRHRSRGRADPSQPNLRQVHLIGADLIDELREAGFDVSPGRLGENVLTQGLDLLALPVKTRLALGRNAVIELTGLRNPCAQLNEVGPGLMQRLAPRDSEGRLIRRAGVMSVVVMSGEIVVGDVIRVELPPKPHRAMDRV